VGKIYHYHLHLDRILDPFHRLYSLHVFEKISIDKLYEGALSFIGTHDFTSFANEAHRGVASHDPIRTMKRLDIVPQEGGVRLEFEADGFLYKMVRNIVGLLLEVAARKRPVEDIPQIFEAKSRPQAGKAVPPHGLFLVKVLYPETT
jgi:tRNA pseudouridine38-40 synthase